MRVVFDAPAGLTRDVVRLAMLLPRDFPHVAEVVAYFGAVAEETWVEWALGKSRLPDGRRIHARTGAYAASIKRRDASEGFQIAEEIATDSPYHDALDSGTPEVDLKKMLLTSLRVRLSKKGHRYMVIPFRHATEDRSAGGGPESALGYGVTKMADHPGYAGGNVIPRRIRDWFAQEERAGAAKSERLSAGERPTGQPGRTEMVPAFRYTWGARYAGRAGEGERSKLTSRGNYTWKRGLYAGMVHFSEGSFRTFRTMSEASPAASWMKPPRAGLRILDQLRDSVLAAGFEAAVAQAVEADFGGFAGFFSTPGGGGGGGRG